MAKRISKRRKRLLWALVTSIVVMAAIGVALVIRWNSREVYTPGEEIEGLTSELTRGLPEDYPRVTFTDVTEQAGIHFNHFSGQRTIQLPEDMGSGLAWGDYDNDGFDDVFIANFSGNIDMSDVQLINSAAVSQLYHNNKNGTFTEVGEYAGLALKKWANGCAWGDYDSDGLLDLVVSCYGKNMLFHNNGDGTFSDMSEKSSISKFEGFWTGVNWGDYNMDGKIDLYVCGYVNYQKSANLGVSLQYNAEVPASINPSSFKPIKNLLFKNNGDGTFTELADKVGVANETGRSLAATWCDFDNDGYPDIYVANDVSDNAMYRNKGDGTFEDLSYNSFTADYRGAMGIGTGDWDNDGDFDMFITHWMAQENALYTNMIAQLNKTGISDGNRLKFMDEADRYGLGQIALGSIGFGTFFFDYNNDGFQDIFATNGSTFQKRDNPKELIPMKDFLFWNPGTMDGFYNTAPASGKYFSQEYVGRGAAYADYDNDGDLDVMVTNNVGPAILLRNDGGNSNKWIGIKLISQKKNTFGIGATISVVSGKIRQVRQVGSQGSYLSQCSLAEYFGLDKSVAADSIIIKWPGGNEQILTNVPSNQILSLEEHQ